MRKLAVNAEIDIATGDFRIDGVDFPWLTLKDGVTASSLDGCAAVTVTILLDHGVRFIDSSYEDADDK